MRTTLDLDDDVLRAARVLAAQESLSLGRAVSSLVRRGLASARTPVTADFPLLPDFGAEHVITDDLVAAHRDDR